MKPQTSEKYERHVRRDDRAMLSAYQKRMIRKATTVRKGYRRNRKG